MNDANNTPAIVCTITGYENDGSVPESYQGKVLRSVEEVDEFLSRVKSAASRLRAGYFKTWFTLQAGGFTTEMRHDMSADTSASIIEIVRQQVAFWSSDRGAAIVRVWMAHKTTQQKQINHYQNTLDALKTSTVTGDANEDFYTRAYDL